MYIPKKRHLYQKILSILLIGLSFSGIFQNLQTGFAEPFSASNSSTSENSVNSLLWKFSNGMPGTSASMQPLLVNLSTNGISNLIIGAEKGVAILNLDGSIQTTFVTYGSVVDIEIINDLTGDGLKDLIVIVYDKTHSNVYAVSSSNGTQLWTYNTFITGFDSEAYIRMNYTTRTWDSVVINDINADGFQDVVIASWKYLYTVSGIDGSLIWKKLDVCADDIWKVKGINDVNSNNFQEVVVGSENGEIVVIDSKTSNPIWSNRLPTRSLLMNDGSNNIRQITFSTSVCDIYVIRDLNQDFSNEILVTGEDGILRLYSGKTGSILNSVIFYPVYVPTTPQTIYLNGDEYELLDWVDRVFYKRGAKILETPDINADGFPDYMIYSRGLEIVQTSYNPSINLITVNQTTMMVNSLHSFNVTTSTTSYPLIQQINSQWRIYMQGKGIGIFYYTYEPITDEISAESTIVFTELSASDPTFYLDSTSYTSCLPFLIESQDQTGDGVAELFFFSAKNQYAIFNSVSESVIWLKYAKKGIANISNLQDLNGDQIPDYLYRNVRDFAPEWISETDTSQRVKYQIQGDLVAINGKDGTILWALTLPSYDYEGILNLTDIGDINDDGKTDFASWIIPSVIPQDVITLMKSNYGVDSIAFASSYDRTTIYRALMWNYTRLIVIDGSNGNIIRNKNLFETPYNFARKNMGTSPSKGNYWNTINGEYDATWLQSTSYPIYGWEKEWTPSSLIDPQDVTLLLGELSNGNYFDLSGNQGKSFFTQASVSSTQINLGKSNSTIRSALSQSDNTGWLLNSTKISDADRINLTCTFELNQSIPNDIQSLTLSYAGQLSKVISIIRIMAWNYNTNEWVELSASDINSTNLMKKQFKISSVHDFCNTEQNNQSRFQLFTDGSTLNHSIVIDEFAVSYEYQYNNVTIESQTTGIGNSIVFTSAFNVNFTNNLNLGLIDYPLSQLDRISALKIQAQYRSNVSDSIFYNMTYQLWNVTSHTWVECNWSDSDSYWNSGFNSNQDLYGGWNDTYRSGYNHFAVGTTSYQTDSMYVVARGTYDKDSSYDFNYQQRTPLSDFVDPISKTIQVRFNITNSFNSFNLTMDTFKIQAFCWDITSEDYDSIGIWDYKSDDFSDDNLLNLEVQDFVAINGTGDSYCDILAILGGKTNSEPVQLRFFDVKNNLINTKWDTNVQILPTNNVKTIVYNLNSTTGWMLLGEYQYTGTNLYSIKTISDAHWSQTRSRFDPSPAALQLDFGSSMNLTRNNSNPVYFPIIKPITKSGDLGLVTADIDYNVNYVSGINILNITTFEIISKCPFSSNYQESTIKTLDGLCVKFQCLIASDDFNGDGWLDHVVKSSNINVFSIGIYDGTSGAETSKLLDSHQLCYFPSNSYYCTQSGCYSSIVYNGIGFAPLGDTDGDGISELVYGLQSQYFDSSEYKGLEINSYNPKSKTNSSWLLENWRIPQWSSGINKKPFDSVTPVGDLNNDGISEFCVKYYQSMYVSSFSQNQPVSEIVDVKNSKILMRMAISFNSFEKTFDLNNDSNVDYLLTSNNMVYCMNGAYRVQFSNIQSGDIKAGRFTLSWNSNSSDHPNFELYVDGTRYGLTSAKSIDVSLTSGIKQIEIFMYDPTGVVIAMDSIIITVEAQPTMLIVTIISIIGLISIGISVKIIRKKRAASILINESAPTSNNATLTTEVSK